jgi:hypothetical protein
MGTRERIRSARAALAAGDHATARAEFRAVLAATEGRPSGDPERVAALNGLLKNYEREHTRLRADDPVAFFRGRLTLLDEFDPQPNLVRATTRHALALALHDAGERDEASRTIEDVVEYLTAVLGANAEPTRRAEATRRRISDRG